MSYGSRLQEAMRLAGKSREELAVAAGVTVQAIGQCSRGETKFLKVDGSAKAAAFLDVDHYWLATGDGNPRPDRAWPFELFLPSEYAKLDQSVKTAIENELAGAILRQKRQVANSRS